MPSDARYRRELARLLAAVLFLWLAVLVIGGVTTALLVAVG